MAELADPPTGRQARTSRACPLYVLFQKYNTFYFIAEVAELADPPTGRQARTSRACPLYVLFQKYNTFYFIAEVAELADAHDSKSCGAIHVGSTPTFGTTLYW